MNQFTIKTRTRTDFIRLDSAILEAITQKGFRGGILTIFIPHTTAGVMINENADPDVLGDLEDVFNNMVPWQNHYRHFEGNTAAHAKAAMVGSSVQVIVEEGQLQMGTWQSIFFCEFDGPRTRQVWIKGI